MASHLMQFWLNVENGKRFDLLDSHNRHEKGLPVPYGTSALLRFANVGPFERYLIGIYLQKNSVFYQVQFANIVISEEASINILKTDMKSFKRLRKRKKHIRQKNLCSPSQTCKFYFCWKDIEKINIGWSLIYFYSLQSLFA